MGIIQSLVAWDTDLFLYINSFHSDFFDGVMVAISQKLTWIPFYFAVVYALIKRWGRESIWLVLALILCLAIADQVSSGLIKEWVQRLRPSHELSLANKIHLVNGAKGPLYGFVSSHAANSFGFALLSSLIFRNKIYTYVIFSWAILTVYSRIYLGVHYPLDIVGGILVGVLAASVCYYLIRRLRPSLLLNSQNNTTISTSKTLYPLILQALSFMAIIVYSLIYFC